MKVAHFFLEEAKLLLSKAIFSQFPWCVWLTECIHFIIIIIIIIIIY